MLATKAKTESEKATHPSPAAVTSAVSRVADLVDDILIRAAGGSGHDDLTEEDLIALHRSGLERRSDRERAIGRARRVIDLRAISGTRKERDDLAEGIAAAEKIAAEQLPGIDAEIERLIRRRKGLVDGVEQDRESLRRMHAAVEKLQDSELMPPAALAELHSTQKLRWDAHDDCQRAEERLRNVEGMLRALDSPSVQRVWDASGSLEREVTPELVDELEQRRAVIEGQLRHSQTMRKAYEQDREQILSRYVI